MSKLYFFTNKIYMTDKKFLLLDVETTGFNRPEVVALAYKVYGEQMISFGYFHPEKEIHAGASAVNHITNKCTSCKVR